MKITKAYEEMAIFFDVEKGQIFEFRGELYMRISINVDDDNVVNAVSLEDYTLVSFYDTDEVILRNAELIVR